MITKVCYTLILIQFFVKGQNTFELVSMVMSWILNTIEAFLHYTISYKENTYELWDDIKERFSVANKQKVQQQKLEHLECKQGGLSIVIYYGKLKVVWDEMGIYQQIPTCSYER